MSRATMINRRDRSQHGRAAGRGAVRNRLSNVRRRFGDMVVQLIEGPDVRAASWRLPSSPRSASTARRFTRLCLRDWGMADLTDTAELLVSELVTNALRHTSGAIRLTLTRQDDVLRGEVEDTGKVLPLLTQVTDYDESGRGLHLVDMLACCWGGIRTDTGKVMWFELQTKEVSL